MFVIQRTNTYHRYFEEGIHFSQYKEGSFSGHGKANLTDAEKENMQLKKKLRGVQL